VRQHDLPAGTIDPASLEDGSSVVASDSVGYVPVGWTMATAVPVAAIGVVRLKEVVLGLQLLRSRDVPRIAVLEASRAEITARPGVHRAHHLRVRREW
jgi:hypothetical protein